MTRLEMIKAKYQKAEVERIQELQKAELERKEAQEKYKSFDLVMADALKSNDVERYVKAKGDQRSIGARIEYFDDQIARLNQQKVENIQELVPTLRQIYDESLTEYKKACEECVRRIDDLDQASKKAKAIVEDYTGVTAYFSSQIASKHISEIGIIPAEFPNTAAVNLTKNLLFVRDELEKFTKA